MGNSQHEQLFARRAIRVSDEGPQRIGAPKYKVRAATRTTYSYPAVACLDNSVGATQASSSPPTRQASRNRRGWGSTRHSSSMAASSICPRHYGRAQGVSPRCPRTAINSHRPPAAATCEPDAGAGSNLRATQQNTLVMRRSLGGDKDQGAELPAVMRNRRRRARCVPDRPVNAGYLRSLADSPMHRLTCGRAG
jgi:hypothetical protein